MSEIREILERWTQVAVPLLRMLPRDSLEEEEVAAIERKSLLRLGASRSEIENIEQRLSMHLPSDLKDLLEFSNGFLIPVLGTGPAEFLSSSNIGLYGKREKASCDLWVKMITQFGFDAEPDDGDRHSEIFFPSVHELVNAVAISGQRGHEVLLMCPTSPHSSDYVKLSMHTSSRRYESLAMMLKEIERDSILSLRSRTEDCE